MKLIIEDDEGRKTVVPIVREDVEITIGRQEGNTIRLTERNVSRRHAKLARKSGMVSIEDLGSYNGVKVNGDRIEGTCNLKDGDLVQIGDYDLAIQQEEVKRATPAGSIAPTELDMAAIPLAPAAARGDARKVEEEEGRPSVRRHDATSVINSAQVRSPKTHRVVDVPADQAPRLLLTTTELAGREYALIRSELKIGRTDDNDVAIDHRSLSRNHCKLVREDDSGGWKVVDLQSANGVKVNGETYAESMLRPGDILELGHLRFQFLAPGEEAPDLGQPRAAPAPAKKPKATKPTAAVPVAIGAVLVVAVGLSMGGWYLLGHHEPHPIVARADPTGDFAPGQPATPSARPDRPPPEAARGPDQSDPPAASPNGSKLFEEGKDWLAKKQFAKAEPLLARAADDGVEGAKQLLAQARAERAAETACAKAAGYIKTKELARARQELASVGPDSSFAVRAKALLAQVDKAEKDRRAAAERALAEVRKDAPAENVIEAYRKVVQIDPAYSETHKLLGSKLIEVSQKMEKDDPRRQEYLEGGVREYEEFAYLAGDDKEASRAKSMLRRFYSEHPEWKPRYPLEQAQETKGR